MGTDYHQTVMYEIPLAWEKNWRQGEVERRTIKPNGFGNRCLEILPALKGKPMTDYAVGWLTCFRPSSIRVVKGAATCDCQWATGKIEGNVNNLYRRLVTLKGNDNV